MSGSDYPMIPDTVLGKGEAKTSLAESAKYAEKKGKEFSHLGVLYAFASEPNRSSKTTDGMTCALGTGGLFSLGPSLCSRCLRGVLYPWESMRSAHQNASPRLHSAVAQAIRRAAIPPAVGCVCVHPGARSAATDLCLRYEGPLPPVLHVAIGAP